LELYSLWGENYELIFVRIARNVLRDVMAEFEAMQVFYERSKVSSAMSNRMKQELEPYKCIIENF